MKLKINKKGFSLPEVIIAVTLVSLIIMTATNLLVSSVRANKTNMDQIIAYNLAEEALEGIRNIRDGNWLNNRIWKGDSNPGKQIFGDSFDTDGFYIIDRQPNLFAADNCNTFSLTELNKFSTVSKNAPWKLTEITNAEDSKKKLYFKKDGDLNIYTHQITNEESGFSRWLEIKSVEGKENLAVYVTAVVEWQEGSVTKRLKLPTILTDWKSGPL